MTDAYVRVREVCSGSWLCKNAPAAAIDGLVASAAVRGH